MNISAFFKAVIAFITAHRIAAAIVLAVSVAIIGFMLGRMLHPPKPLAAVDNIIVHLNEAATPEALEPSPINPVPENEKSALPRIAIVIDDVGMREDETAEAIALPPAVTLSFFPYAPNAQGKVNDAKAAGHDIFMHVPMEALGEEDPGPDALRVDMDDDVLHQLVEKNLDSFVGYTGVNNHMGSRFTADERCMRLFMDRVKARGLIFLDSRTNAATKGEEIAREMGVKTVRRHIFLDNTLTEESIADQFAALLKLADKQNMAVAIGHPHHVTLEFLAKVLPYLRSRYELVPVSALAK